MEPVEIYDNLANATERPRDWGTSLVRGLQCRCPACGTGRLYVSYLKPADTCPQCGEELHHQRADDAPPYFTMLIVGHVIVGGVLMLEQAASPQTWVHLVVWLPLTALLSLWLLPKVKGALIGLQWALRMHGFGGESDVLDAQKDPAHPL